MFTLNANKVSPVCLVNSCWVMFLLCLFNLPKITFITNELFIFVSNEDHKQFHVGLFLVSVALGIQVFTCYYNSLHSL